MIRSVALFTHVVGMLVLFIGIAFEWLGLESLRRATTPEHASSWVRLQKMLPRVYGIALATLLASGMYLARHIGAFDLAFVRLGLGLMVLMGILGGLRVALFMRAAIGLAVVYLMIDKPLLGPSLVVTGVAVAVGLAISLLKHQLSKTPARIEHVAEGRGQL
jgi:hypothetical protein